MTWDFAEGNPFSRMQLADLLTTSNAVAKVSDERCPQHPAGSPVKQMRKLRRLSRQQDCLY